MPRRTNSKGFRVKKICADHYYSVIAPDGTEVAATKYRDEAYNIRRNIVNESKPAPVKRNKRKEAIAAILEPVPQSRVIKPISNIEVNLAAAIEEERAKRAARRRARAARKAIVPISNIKANMDYLLASKPTSPLSVSDSEVLNFGRKIYR